MRKSVAPGVYFNDSTGRYSYRPWVHGRRTERTLKATTLGAALKEYHRRIDEPQTALDLEAVCAAYLEAGAPSRAGAPRDEDFISWERRRINELLPFFRKITCEELRIHHCLLYRDWRVKSIREGCSGLRSVDMELGTLSNAINYAVLKGDTDANRILGRPRFNVGGNVSHCRDHCPRSGDELHQLAGELMKRYDGEVMGWQMLFEATSGCRTGEALPLRWDAAAGQPGHIRDEKYICISRLKQGDDDPFDYIEINPALKRVMEGLKRWNSDGWFFPSARRKEKAVQSSALSLALRRIVPKLLPGRRITSHGMRAFYVTWRRVSGIPVSQIAEEIGHRSGTGLIYSTYGRKVPPWAENDFSPFPKTVAEAW